MDGIRWLRSLEGGSAGHREADWLDVLVYAEEQPKPTAWLAETMGVHLRSAERYLAAVGGGKGGIGAQPTRGPAKAGARVAMAKVTAEWAEADQAEQRQQVADLLRLVDTIEIPPQQRVVVASKSDRRARESERRIKKPLTGMNDRMQAVADAWEDEDQDEAAELLGAAILDAYGDAGNVEHLSSNIRIVDYPDGIDYS